MNRATRFAIGALLALAARPAGAADGPASLPRSTPESQGVASPALLDFVEAADARLDSLHSVMILRHGSVVAEGWWSPYAAETRHELYSLSKSFTSTAVGLAIAEGKLSVDDPVLAAFPDDAPPDPSANLKAMRLRDLLRMSAGHQAETSSKADAITPKAFLAHPVPFKPGTHFLYNTPATFMASAMVQKATGQTVLDYLKPRLFEPLGIEDPTWDASAQGISLGGYGLSLRTEDIAKFGQLCLQKGEWRGRRLVPAAWIEQATGLQTSNGSNPKSDWEQGYGYQFWRARHGAYRGDGAFGQYCLVIPDRDVVVAITSGLGNMPAVLDLVWEKLLPAIHPGVLAESPDDLRKLRDRLGSLSLKRPAGSASTPILAQVAGKTYAFPANEKKLEAVRVEPGPNPGDLAIVLKAAGGEQRIECAGEGWKRGTFVSPALGERKVAAGGAWVADDTFAAKVAVYETPFVLDLKLRFAGDELFYDSAVNVRGKDPQLVGRRQ